MGDINEVLERLITDPGFRRLIKENPAEALSGYDLDESELELLANQLTGDTGADSAVETRTSKAALSGLFGLFGGDGAAAKQGFDDAMRIESWSWGETNEGGALDEVASAEVDPEPYEYPGAYAQRFDGIDPAGGDAATDDMSMTLNFEKGNTAPDDSVGASESVAVGSNQTEDVDEADFATWQKNFGSTPSADDGSVESSDFLQWQDQPGDDAGDGANEIVMDDDSGAEAIELEPTKVTSYSLGGATDDGAEVDDLAVESDEQEAAGEQTYLNVELKNVQVTNWDLGDQPDEPVIVGNVPNPEGEGEMLETDGVVGPKTMDPVEELEPDETTEG